MSNRVKDLLSEELLALGIKARVSVLCLVGKDGKLTFAADGVPIERVLPVLQSYLSSFIESRSRTCFGRFYVGKRKGLQEDFSTFGVEQLFCDEVSFNGKEYCSLVLLSGYVGRDNNDDHVVSKLQSLSRILEYRLVLLSSSEANFTDLETAALAHDLRAPINAIRAALSVEAIETVYSNLELMDQYVSSMLRLSREGADEPKSLFLYPEIERAVDRIEFKFVEKGLELSLTGDAEAQVYLHSGDLQRILDNILSNALRHTDSGGVIIKIEVDSMVSVTVSDSGAGIEKEVLSRVCEPLKRFSRKSGLGLGLHVVKTLVERNSGSLAFESELGSGTSVCMSFPKAA